jgi:hypothetical protein
MEDVHFLSRLARVNQPHVELALTLYRDPGLVRYLLSNLQLPEGASRVAVSLADEHEGPFIIVTREGIFVTCLGEGMTTGDVPVVSRRKLDATMERVADTRARYEMARKRCGEEGTKKIIGRVLDDGLRLSREDFYAAGVWAPLLHAEFALAYFRALNELADHRHKIERIKHPKPEQYKYLKRAEAILFSTGHLALLMTMSGPQPWMEEVISSMNKQVDAFTWGTTRYGIACLALKGALGVSRVGKMLLPNYKRATVIAPSRMQILSSLLGLGAIALGHGKYKAEVCKVLERFRGEFAEDAPLLEKVAAKEKQAYGGLLIKMLEEPDQATEMMRRFGQLMAVKNAHRHPEGSPYRFTKVEEVPDELAFPLAANHIGDHMNNADDILFLFCCLPWVSRAKPEDLYLPSSFLRTYWGPYDPKDTVFLASRWVEYYGKARPVTVTPVPGRNELCNCGSGKKYKKCHGQ